jgi:2-oxoisovalerate dehydrogenase E1 component subunit alpha
MAMSDSGASKNSKTVAKFEIQYTQYLDAEGRSLGPLPEVARDASNLIPLYRGMVLVRSFDAKAVALQRTGQLGTYPSSLGQEAVDVVAGQLMEPQDTLLPSYRDTGALLARGVRMSEILLYWGGDERGMNYAVPRADFPISVPVASHVTHAAGAAYAFKYRKEPRVAVCLIGDGATSKGDFYEAINAAGVWQLPMVVVVINNHWAISVPRQTQSRAATLAQKAIAAGIEGEQVDGNDGVALTERLAYAIGKARAGGGPHLIEALTYRLTDHTTADDARRYRSQEELAEHQRLDPVDRLGKFLRGAEVWNDSDEIGLLAQCTADIEQAVAEYLATPPAPPEAMFDYLFESLPAALREQRAAVGGERNG